MPVLCILYSNQLVSLQLRFLWWNFVAAATSFCYATNKKPMSTSSVPIDTQPFIQAPLVSPQTSQSHMTDITRDGHSGLHPPSSHDKDIWTIVTDVTVLIVDVSHGASAGRRREVSLAWFWTLGDNRHAWCSFLNHFRLIVKCKYLYCCFLKNVAVM